MCKIPLKKLHPTKLLNYHAEEDDDFNTFETLFENRRYYYQHPLARNEETKNGYKEQTAKVFHLSKIYVAVQNKHPSNALKYRIEVSPDKEIWISKVTETELVAKTNAGIEISEAVAWIRVAWKSAVENAHAIINAVVSAKN